MPSASRVSPSCDWACRYVVDVTIDQLDIDVPKRRWPRVVVVKRDKPLVACYHKFSDLANARIVYDCDGRPLMAWPEDPDYWNREVGSEYSGRLLDDGDLAVVAMDVATPSSSPM